ncbi:MAG: sulfatase, partial [bacterium]
MICARYCLCITRKPACWAAIFFSALFLSLIMEAGHCAQAQARISCPDCNVILVSLDTLRADALGIYGCRSDTSPNIDRLAATGAVFLNAYSQSPNTLPSHMSIFTSQYPWTHEVENLFRDRLPSKTLTLPMVFKKHGYHTVWAANLDAMGINLSAGFERGCNEFISSDPMRGRRMKITWGSAFSWLEKNRNRKFFMFLHTYLIHDPYMPEKSSILRFSRFIPPEKNITGKKMYLQILGKAVSEPLRLFKEMRSTGFYSAFGRLQRDVFWKYFDLNSPEDIAYIRTLYDAVVFEADMAIGALYARLEDLGLAEKTLLIITSDHGEEFMEHGRVSHTQVYNEHLHVPLIFILPGKHAGIKPAQIVQSIDIMPTILELAGLPAPEGTEGRSLVPLMKGGKPDVNAMAFARWRVNYSVRDSRRTYIRKNKCPNRSINQDRRCMTEEFYDRSVDPTEKKNIFTSNRHAAEKFSKRLDGMIKSAGKGGENP